MQNTPFNLASCIEFAGKYHGQQKVITRRVEDDIIVEHTYQDILLRVRQFANVLKKLGVKHGDCIGTIGLNTHRHLEAWYAISGQGAICHTINPRLAHNQLEYIINHADDQYILVDHVFWPLIEGMHTLFPNVKGYIVLTEEAFMPKTSLPNVHCYETLLTAESTEFTWPEFDENSGSSLCYTSGTTGNPKGVLYTHKSNLLHSYACGLADVFGMTSSDTVLVVVPLFHANSWGISYLGPIIGANLIFPGKRMDGEAIFELVDNYEVSLAAGVPTVWTALLEYADDNNRKMTSLRDVVVGGSAAPPSMLKAFKNKHDADLLHAWGMTEMSPLGTINRAVPQLKNMSEEEQFRYRIKQGRPVFGVDIKITDEDGKELTRDGKIVGHLLVKGNWVVHTYFKAEEPAVNKEGWFDTGDMATIDEFGYMEIIDRAKDLIKSGGEWISSVDMENKAMGHPDVSLAAAIGIPDEKWSERPILIVVPKAGKTPSKQSIIDYLSSEFAKWQLPDDVVFVDALPMTATGKFSKLTLRQQFSNHKIEE
jgi:fatty-acyl-CoA synthase